MRSTNYSHEQETLSEAEQMREQLRKINAATDGEHAASLAEYPDLLQTAPATAELSAHPLQSASPAEVRQIVATPASAASQPRIVTAAPVVARSEEETYLAEQRAMGIEALARANREAL